MTDGSISSTTVPNVASDGPPGSGIVGKIDALSAWLIGAIKGISHLSVLDLLTKVAAVVAVYVAVQIGVYVVRRLLRRRAAADGYLVRVIPPRTVDVTRSADVWRLLHSLVRRCHGGWHLSKLPLSVEVQAREGRLTWCLWVPAWVPLAAVQADAEQAWPGAVVQPWQPDNDTDETGAEPRRYAAGRRLAVYGTDNASLVRETRLTDGADPLRAVLSSLSLAGGPATLQVLLRPPSRWRMRALKRAAAGKPARKPPALVAIDGVLSFVVSLVVEVIGAFLPGPSASRRTSSGSPARSGESDGLQRQAMRDAAAKLADRPHLEAAFRVVVSGSSRGEARSAARSIVDNFAVAGHDLTTARLSRPVQAVRDRWAGTREWLLMSCTELGVLAHIPADPAWYGFDTAALNRPYPVNARLAEPEKPKPDTSGWSGKKWTPPRQPSPPALPDPPNWWAKEDEEWEHNNDDPQDRNTP